MAFDKTKRRQEPFGLVALGLGILLILSRLEGETIWLLHRNGKRPSELVAWCICVFVIATPFAISWRRLRRYPGRWHRGLENLVITACLLAFQIVGLVFLLLDWQKI